MAASCAIYVAAKHKPRRLVIDGAYTSILGVLPWYTKILFYPSLRYQFKSSKYIPKVTCPTLIAHSKTDGTVPYSVGRSLFRTAQVHNKKARFYEYEGHHNAFSGRDTKYFYKMMEFLEQPAQFQTEGPKADRRDIPNFYSLETILSLLLG